MKKATLIVEILLVVVGLLELVHATLGFGVAPISAARDVYRDVTSEAPATVEVNGPSSDDLVESAEELDEAMDEIIEESFDSTPPSQPMNLRVAGQVQCQVTLKWDPSTDDEELSGYRIHASGSVGGMVDERFTEFKVTLFPGDTTTFTVSAFDGSMNESKLSNEVTPATC